MATRGRPNPAAKKPAAKAAAKPAAKSAKAKATGGKLGSVISAGKSLLGMATAGKGKAKGTGRGRGRISAKARLKKAYERRAIREIRQGNLGKARRTLRKKQTVV